MKVEASAVIERALDEVFSLAADPKNDPLWASVVAEAKQTSEGPLAVGTTYEQVLRLLGRRLKITFEVTEYEPNQRVHIGRFSGRLRSAAGRRTFEAAPGGTRVTFAGEGTSGLFLNLLEPLVNAAARRAVTRDLANLKEVLKEGSSSGPIAAPTTTAARDATPVLQTS